jgi:hypothetical protein
MPAPDAANLALHCQNWAQAVAGIAAEAQHLPNWQPAAQQQTLAQILHELQQLQQRVQHVQQVQQQMQQQVQQVPQQLQQMQQQMQQQAEVQDYNALARLENNNLSARQQVMWLRNSAGQEPQHPPVTLTILRRASGATVDTLLAHYSLPTHGAVHERCSRLLLHLGICSG